MPIVLSYNDVDALGSLAYKTGGLYGQARRADQNAALLAQIDAQRNQAAINLQEVSARQRDADLERQLRANLAADELQYRYDISAAGERELQTQMSNALAEAQLKSQAGFQEQILTADLKAQEDKRLQEMNLQRIEREAQLGKYDRRREESVIPPSGGLPSKEFVQQEIQEYGHLIPFEAGKSVSAESAARTRDRAMEIATSLSGLPTNQIEAYIQQRPNDPWTPYMRAIVQARMAISGTGSRRPSRPVGAMPEGPRPPGFPTDIGSRRSIPGPRGNNAGLSSGRGLGDPILGQLNDTELQQLAQDPVSLEKFMNRR
jgi:hypothetical protein